MPKTVLLINKKSREFSQEQLDAMHKQREAGGAIAVRGNAPLSVLSIERITFDTEEDEDAKLEAFYETLKPKTGVSFSSTFNIR